VSVPAKGRSSTCARAAHPLDGLLKAFKLTQRGRWNLLARPTEKRHAGSASMPRVHQPEGAQPLPGAPGRAKRRDHRKLGHDLDLFSFSDEAGAGLEIWHPKGALLRTIIAGLRAPRCIQARLRHRSWVRRFSAPSVEDSGHFRTTYRENMYFTEIDEQGYGIKPMNWPGAHAHPT